LGRADIKIVDLFFIISQLNWDIKGVVKPRIKGILAVFKGREETFKEGLK
jgi:hypothetical protein